MDDHDRTRIALGIVEGACESCKWLSDISMNYACMNPANSTSANPDRNKLGHSCIYPLCSDGKFHGTPTLWEPK